MTETLNADDEPEPSRVSGTAWWGFCFHCRRWFNNHLVGCQALANAVPSTGIGTIVWPTTYPTTATTNVYSQVVKLP